MAGVTIQVLDSLKRVIATMGTNNNGFYGFIVPRYGNYTLVEIVHNGFINTTPTSVPMQLTLTSLSITVNFGNAKLAIIDGLKYLDLNMIGVYAPEDPALPGWTIYLNNSTVLAGMNTTDANGHFIFTGLTPGTYTINEAMQPEFKNTIPQTMNITLASGQTLNATTAYGLSDNAQSKQLKFACVANSG
jgi:hypothetical protein